MIFFDGEIYENDMCDKLLSRFEDRICDTLGNCRLSAKQVMLAAEKISTDIENGAFDDMLTAKRPAPVSSSRVSGMMPRSRLLIVSKSVFASVTCDTPDSLV